MRWIFFTLGSINILWLVYSSFCSNEIILKNHKLLLLMDINIRIILFIRALGCLMFNFVMNKAGTNPYLLCECFEFFFFFTLGSINILCLVYSSFCSNEIILKNHKLLLLMDINILILLINSRINFNKLRMRYQ